MVLIVTERGDLTADFLVLELEARGAEFLRLNTEDYPTQVNLVWSPDGAHLALGGRTIDLADVDAVWYRRPRLPQLPSDYSEEEAAWASREAYEALQGLWRTLTARWVNHPDANRRAECKPDQLCVARGLGLAIPPTLITNVPARLTAFLERHPSVICKPLLDGLVPRGEDQQLFFTSEIEAGAPTVEALGNEPYLFQGLVEKELDVRVTVIGTEVFAVGIESQAVEDTRIDWRRGAERGLPHRVLELPNETRKGCLALCRHYGLEFGAIDLALGPDGGYTFFEINPNGQWAWLERETGLPLRSRLADLLVGVAVQ
jgi:glutathione synthase/RimK-type ligase-like ATP-grasp enzyme